MVPLHREKLENSVSSFLPPPPFSVLLLHVLVAHLLVFILRALSLSGQENKLLLRCLSTRRPYSLWFLDREEGWRLGVRSVQGLLTTCHYAWNTTINALTQNDSSL